MHRMLEQLFSPNPCQKIQILSIGVFERPDPRAPVLIGRLDFACHAPGFEHGVYLIHVRDKEADMIDAGCVLEEA
jgi:hypothetical protein